MKNFIAKMISLDVKSGSKISEVLEEAVIISIEEKCLVEFDFNHQRFLVDAQKMILNEFEGQIG